MSKLRVAVVGAGPAGIYASDILRNEAEGKYEVEIDLFDRLPAPYGLVRYGVAPDHPRIKGVVRALREVLDKGGIRVFGNVDFGTDITIDDLRERYHAVIFATGAIRDADLSIPGIDAEGSYGAADFVNWYDAHPDVPREWPLDVTAAAVVGNGNVALDVTRVLAKQADDMLPTEIPENVYAGLKDSKITDVHVFGRRGPLQVKFTPLELRELGEVPQSQIVLDEDDFDVDPAADEEAKKNKQLLVISRIFNKWRETEANPDVKRRIHLHFWSRPDAVLKDEQGRVRALRVERTEPDGQGGVRGTGEMREYPVGQVYRAVGYFGSPLERVPFDTDYGVIPNSGGRVLDADGEPVPGMFATGWIKRGPIGLIGHTKSDAKETIEHLLASEATWWQPSVTEADEVVSLLEERGVKFTDLDGWHNLDAHEISLGEPHERERIKVVDREEMLRISLGED